MTSSYRTPHEVRVAIDGMGGDDWLQRAIEHHSDMNMRWCHATNMGIPTHGPPGLGIMSSYRYERVVAGFREAGLCILGKGCFGTVFELRKDDPWVYKLVSTSNNDAYLSFIRWARAQRTGPHRREAWVRCLPRAKVLFEDRWFALIRVERLVAQDSFKATAYGLGAVIAYTAALAEPVFEPYFAATSRILAEKLGSNDMHSANIMLRPTKCGTFEPVHTDPVN